jgi:hypothetical protein
LGGYNSNDDINRVIYLNGKKINNNDLFIWEENSNFNNYIKENKNNLKIKNNKYTIKIKKMDQITYIKQTVIDWLE